VARTPWQASRRTASANCKRRLLFGIRTYLLVFLGHFLLAALCFHHCLFLLPAPNLASFFLLCFFSSSLPTLWLLGRCLYMSTASCPTTSSPGKMPPRLTLPTSPILAPSPSKPATAPRITGTNTGSQSWRASAVRSA